MPAPTTPDKIDDVLGRLAAGQTYGQIAQALGTSRNAIGGIVFRARKAGDPRVPEAGPTPIVTVEQERSLVADAFVDGAPSIGDVATKTGLAADRVKRRWAEIRATLGSQAR